MQIAFIDHETTGLPAYGKRSDDPAQPYVVSQAIRVDVNRDTIRQHYSLVIPATPSCMEAEMVHGLSQEYLERYGGFAAKAANQFWEIVRSADLIVAHNAAFDRRIARIAIKRFLGEKVADKFMAIQHFCTMQEYKKLKGIPYRGKGGSLDAACADILNEKPRERTHHALDDMMRCAALYYALQKLIEKSNDS